MQDNAEALGITTGQFYFNQIKTACKNTQVNSVRNNINTNIFSWLTITILLNITSLIKYLNI